MEKKLNIFISSTYLDLKKERKLVAEIIHRLGHNALGMEFFSAGRRTQWENITDWIDKSDVFIVLTKCRYGTIFQNDKSYTECEVDYILTKGKQIIPIMCSRKFKKKKYDNKNHLNSFKSKLSEPNPKWYKYLYELTLEVVCAIRDVEKHPKKWQISDKSNALEKLNNPSDWVVDYEDIYYEPESDYAITVDEEIKKDIKEIKEVASFQNDTCIKSTVWEKYHEKIISDFDLLYTYKYGNILKGIRRIKKFRFIEFYIRHYPENYNEGVYYFPSEIWKCITKKDIKPDMAEEELRDLIIRTDEYKMCLVLAQNESHKTFNTSENDFILSLIDFTYIKEKVIKFGKDTI